MLAQRLGVLPVDIGAIVFPRPLQSRAAVSDHARGGCGIRCACSGKSRREYRREYCSEQRSEHRPAQLNPTHRRAFGRGDPRVHSSCPRVYADPTLPEEERSSPEIALNVPENF